MHDQVVIHRKFEAALAAFPLCIIMSHWYRFIVCVDAVCGRALFILVVTKNSNGQLDAKKKQSSGECHVNVISTYQVLTINIWEITCESLC